jgi:Kef-type K+ transport system membrane component KefB
MTTATTDANRKMLNRTGAVVAVLVVLTLGISIGALVHFDIPKDNHDILLVLVTAVATNVTAIVAYFFGSSISNSRQGEIINTMANTAANTAAAAVLPIQTTIKTEVPPP